MAVSRCARNNQVPHAIIAVDKRGRRRGAVYRDVGPGIGRTELKPLHILHQTEHAVRIGTDQVGFQHEFGDFSGVILRHAGLAHGIDDQARDGRCRNAGSFRGLDVH